MSAEREGERGDARAVMVMSAALFILLFGTVRQFFFDRCCTGRGGMHVSFRTLGTMFNTSVVRGAKGVVVGRGINKRQVELNLKTGGFRFH